MTSASPRRRRILAGVLATLLTTLLAACAPLPPVPPAGAELPSQAARYRTLAAQGQPILDINGAQSLISIRVGSSGVLGHLGHEHIVASRSLSGSVAPQAGLADCQFRLDQLSVDEPVLRAAAGFDSNPTPDAIAGTRYNMLNKVLDAEQFPLVLLHITRRSSDHLLTLELTLHGVTRSMALPAVIDSSADGGLVISGDLQLDQSDFGLTPYSVLGGAIAVRDRLEMHFRIVAAPR